VPLLLLHAMSFGPPFAARAGNRPKGRLITLQAHTKAPYEIDFHRETLRNAN
jgi:hypothetical protein